LHKKSAVDLIDKYESCHFFIAKAKKKA